MLEGVDGRKDGRTNIMKKIIPPAAPNDAVRAVDMIEVQLQAFGSQALRDVFDNARAGRGIDQA